MMIEINNDYTKVLLTDISVTYSDNRITKLMSHLPFYNLNHAATKLTSW